LLRIRCTQYITCEEIDVKVTFTAENERVLLLSKFSTVNMLFKVQFMQNIRCEKKKVNITITTQYIGRLLV
jgi:hypothetical protein